MRKIKNYTVTLKVTDYNTFTVTADDIDEAAEIARQMYIENLKTMLPRYSFEEMEVEDYDVDYEDVSN